MNKFLGISLAIFGIAIAVIPFVSDCASHATGMQMPMVCYGNRTSELMVGIPLFVVGSGIAFVKVKTRAVYYSLAGLAAVLGLIGILSPLAIVGTCSGPLMSCNTLMKPSAITVGSLAIIGGFAGLVIANKKKF